MTETDGIKTAQREKPKAESFFGDDIAQILYLYIGVLGIAGNMSVVCDRSAAYDCNGVFCHFSFILSVDIVS